MQFERKRKHVATGIDFYMKQFGVSKERAAEEIFNIVSNAWKDLNQELMRPHSVNFSLLMPILNLSRVIHVFYRYQDAYTHPEFLKEHVVSLLVENIPIWECCGGGDYTNEWPDKSPDKFLLLRQLNSFALQHVICIFFSPFLNKSVFVLYLCCICNFVFMVSSKLFPFRQVNLFVFCFKIIKNMDLKYVRLIYIYMYIYHVLFIHLMKKLSNLRQLYKWHIFV